jgi:parvulin-like peptidyl-prolyl isomerase
LLSREVTRAGIEVTEADLRQELNRRIEGLILVENLTRAEFESMMAEQRGTPFAVIAEEEIADARFRDFVTHWKLMEKRRPDEVYVSEEEVEAYYKKYQKTKYNQPEKVRVSHILVQVDKDATVEEKQAARRRIDGLLEAVKKPDADFAAIARANSDCPSAKAGGDLGYMKRDMRGSPLAKVAFTLADGEISDVIESRSGFHIIRASGRKAPRLISYDEAKYAILHLLQEQAVTRAKSKYGQELKDSTSVTYVNPDDEARESRPATQPARSRE